MSAGASVEAMEIARSRVKHRWESDTWFSCPMEPNEGCCDDSKPKKCDCDYDGRILSLALSIDALVARKVEEERRAGETAMLELVRLRVAQETERCRAAGQHAWEQYGGDERFVSAFEDTISQPPTTRG